MVRLLKVGEQVCVPRVENVGPEVRRGYARRGWFLIRLAETLNLCREPGRVDVPRVSACYGVGGADSEVGDVCEGDSTVGEGLSDTPARSKTMAVAFGRPPVRYAFRASEPPP